MSTRESIPEPLRLAFAGRSAIEDATLAARDFAQNSGIEEANASRLAIVVEELVANLYDHGGLKTDDQIVLELSLTESEILLTLGDPGMPFDLRLADLDQPAKAGSGGAGLRLVTTWATHAEYQTSGGQNLLSLRLPRSGRSIDPHRRG